jgi:RimJ/RimL family protein N-acetyltransferase
MSEIEIDCGICQLRPWRESDVDALARHANNREIWLNLRDRFPHPYTREDAETWIRIAAAREPVTNFAIEVDGELVGSIGFMLHDDVERLTAETGYWLAEPYWGRGIMSAAVRAATEHAFRAYGLTRVYALPYARNAASARVLEKAGFRREGHLRRSVIKDGVVQDQFLYAITDEEIGIPYAG